jgi:hypothetical protein
MKRGAQDVEKTRFWRKTIREAARSGISVREFCRQRELKEPQFYWWQRKLSATKRPGKKSAVPATFALVSGEPGAGDAGIELVLAGGRRLRIARGVDEATLRTVLAAVESEEC